MVLVDHEVPATLEFGPFRLDVGQRLLLCQGKVVPLAPKLLETLMILVEHSGQIIEKDELMNRLWPDSFVEESSLSQNIFQLRKALGERTRNRQFIETIPKRGYRFAVGVREIGGVNTGALSRPAALVNGEQTRFSVQSLAVLPFKSLGQEKTDEYLGLGMADATIIKLSGLARLSVAPTSAVFKYAGRNTDPLIVGRKLAVDAVLEGTVQRSAGRVRATVQLIAVAERRTLWCGRFDEDFTDLFAVQDAISEKVADSLALRITADERRQLRKRYTENTEAYQSYLMGLFFWNKRSTEGLNQAIEYFQRAIEKDPGYALPYAGLADSYFLIAYREYDAARREEGYQKSRAAALRALELDPFVAEAHAALGTVKVKHDRDAAGAERSFERAILTNPNCAMAYSRYTYFLAAMGRLDEALTRMRRAQELDPLSPDMNASLANVLYFARDYDQAIDYARRALELEPNFLDASVWLGLSYEQKGMYQEAIAEFRRAADTNAQSAEPLELLAHVLASAGRCDEAQSILGALNSPARPGLRPYNVALIHAAFGQTDQACEWLKKPFANWTERLRMLRYDPRMDRLRRDSRFSDIFDS
ncbi:MAG TPA: winged helix-turn-helix domain-containing protein [Pyrinomonadaceae bacterium]|nr:winged helix-turn-helix domain-containing protein [Pyrinomonadaceae bacterium]